MQIPQLYRRGIVRPLDAAAAEQLASYAIAEPIRVEWLAIHSDAQFYEIWETGVFQAINAACQTRISDYEEVELAPHQVANALKAMSRINSAHRAASVFVDRLAALLSAAEEENTTVYFIL